MNCTRYNFFKTKEKINLKQVLFIDKEYSNIQRVRITYDDQIRNIEIIPYTRRCIRHFKIIVDDNINYAYKYADRTAFSKYLVEPDSEIIIIKNDFVTDTSFSNIVFFEGHEWHTPLIPLLKGTMRQYLINAGRIIEKKIRLENIGNYKKFRLINSFNDFMNPYEFDISTIKL